MSNRWECLPCQRSNRRPGKHRAHECRRQITFPSIAVSCDCICQRQLIAAIQSHGGFPPMALGFFDEVLDTDE